MAEAVGYIKIQSVVMQIATMDAGLDDRVGRRGDSPGRALIGTCVAGEAVLAIPPYPIRACAVGLTGGTSLTRRRADERRWTIDVEWTDDAQRAKS